ncbi:MAG: hypothetical protein PHX13_12505 [Thiovulaceae bacterium]|nr:hypothetical protein [Sulfurimonadaceae bacterium]
MKKIDKNEFLESLKSAKKTIGVVVTGAVLAVGTSASAALTAPTIATTDFETVAGAVIVALAVMWAIKKALGLIRV